MGLKTKLAMAVATSAAGAAMIAGGTFAEFSSQASTTNNTFSSGTLQLALSPDNGTTWGAHDANVGATWVSPTNWAPGQTMSATLQATDEGTIGAKHIFFSFGTPTGSAALLSQIDVTSITETFGTGSSAKTVTTNVANLAQQIGVTSGPLTLAQFIAHQYYTDNGGKDVIAPGNQKDYSLTIGLTFDDNAGNAYQGLTSGFDMNLNATQNTPTNGFVSLQQ